MDDEMNGATFPTKADRLFGPNPSGLDESPHGMMVLVFVGMFAGGQFGSRRQVVCGDGCQRILAVRGGIGIGITGVGAIHAREPFHHAAKHPMIGKYGAYVVRYGAPAQRHAGFACGALRGSHLFGGMSVSAMRCLA